MAYLEVFLQEGSTGPIAISANGISLARENGCLSFFTGRFYPMAEDYVRGLEYEGWSLYNNVTTSTVGMIDGMPFSSSQNKLVFTGNGRYQVEWIGEQWNLKGERRY